ncbi:peptidoglycan-binding protein [Kitasatospora sp. NBC_00085]|uniref:peptidoglycan-binding domain-containing protein n=1 Tax=unclassified Kitasatospora TaxID=2633591 RepID=UPI003244AEF2
MQKNWALRAAALTVGAGAVLGLTAGSANAAGLIQLGDSGRAVTCVQQALNYENSAGLQVDGRFGQSTYDAVINFQARQLLAKTGKVDVRTGENILGEVYNDYFFYQKGSPTLRAWLGECTYLMPS